MDLNDHQAKELLKKHGVPVREDALASTRTVSAGFRALALIDLKAALPVLVISPEGASGIEAVATRSTGKTLRLHFDPAVGLWPYQARRAAWFMGFSGDTFESALMVLPKLCEAFVRSHAQSLEINPLGVCEGRLICLNSRISIDDNALCLRPPEEIKL